MQYTGDSDRVSQAVLEYERTINYLACIGNNSNAMRVKQKFLPHAERQFLSICSMLIQYDVLWLKRNKLLIIQEINRLQQLRSQASLARSNDLENIKNEITAGKDWQFIAWKIAKYSAIAGAVGGITAGSGLVVAGTIFAPEMSIPLIVAGSVTVGVTAAASTTVGVVAHNRVS